MSIAFSVAEHIYNVISAKTLFATHYHAINKLSDYYKGIKNYNVAVKEIDSDVIFLRKIVEGGTDKSFGVEVAKLAGVPKIVLDRAKEIMSEFELEDKIVNKIERNFSSKNKDSKDFVKKQSSSVNLMRFSR
jgi:DNA mismatch repair protein MutS